MASDLAGSGGGTMLDNNETGIKYLTSLANTTNYSASALTGGR